MKRPLREERHRACVRKRRYASQAAALDAALIAGVERQRTAYHCALCGRWHLATKPGRDG
jgi:hypothetical protein